MKTRTRVGAFTYCLIAWLSVLLANQLYPCVLHAQQRSPNQDALTIKVLEGEDGVNIVQKNTAVKPVVEVRDRNNLPVAGATVVFILPDSGPSATFARGGRVLTVRTNSAGRASATGMHPVGMGAFNIGVTASFQNQVATATIAQTNFATIAAANAAMQAAQHEVSAAFAGHLPSVSFDYFYGINVRE